MQKFLHKKFLRLVCAVFCILTITVGTTFFLSIGAKADSNIIDTINEKVYLNALYKIFNSNYTKTDVAGGPYNYKISDIVGMNSKAVAIASLDGTKNLTIEQTLTAALKNNGKTPSNIDLTQYGYIANNATTKTQGCVQLNYKIGNSGSALSSNKTCFTLNGSGDNIGSYSVNANDSATGITTEPPSNGALMSVVPNNNGICVMYAGATVGECVSYTDSKGKAKTWGTIVGELEAKQQEYTNIRNADFTNAGIQGVDGSGNLVNSSTEQKSEAGSYTKAKNAALTALRTLTGNSSDNFDNHRFTEKEAYELLQYYYNNLDSVASNAIQITNECQAQKPNSSKAGIWLPKDGMWCKANVADDVSVDFNIVNDGRNALVKVTDLKEFLSKFKSIDYDDPTMDDVEPDVEEIPGTENEENQNNSSSSSNSSNDESDMKECFSNASMLGWIFCPILKFVGTTLEDLYQKVEENFLMTDASKYKDGEKINDGWKEIRNFANIIFAIALTIVILSQVTGFGISNYGIKKMLPTLIMVIVLVNISFFLCQIAIDVSNIVGQGIKDIFDQLTDGGTFANIGDAALANLMGAVGITGVGFAAGTIAFAGLGVMVPVLISLISAIISILFLLLLLSMRQAGIAVLVVLAPAAIICYALPNTKKLYDKWQKLFVTLLMIYPICAAVMGGTSFAADLIAVQGEVFTNVVAIILQVSPCFLIPYIVKSSMNVMGSLGSKVSQIGQRIGGTATGALKKSSAVQGFQERSFAKAANRRSAVYRFRDKYGGEKGLYFTKRGHDNARRRALRDWNQYKSYELKDAESAYAAQGMTAESIQNAKESLKRKFDDQRIDDIANKVINGNGSYMKDGKRVSIDQNNVASIGEAYASAVARASADPSDQRAFDEAAGLQKVLMMQKDKGLEQIEHGLKAQTHNKDGVAVGKNDVTSALAAQMGRDSRWMGDVKTFDPGTFSYFNDLSNKSASLQNNINYASTTAENFKPGKLPDLGDGAFKTIQTYANDQGKLDAQSAYEQAGNVKSLWGAADSIEKAYSDPRIASQIKPDANTLKLHNDIRRSAYNAKVRAYAQMQGKAASEVQQEFINKFGAFHEARPGETIQRDTFDTANYLAHNANMHVPH